MNFRLLNHFDDHPIRGISTNATFLALMEGARHFDLDMAIKLTVWFGGVTTLAMSCTSLYRKWFGAKRIRSMSNILIIDDNEVDLDLYAQAFTRAHCKVTRRVRFEEAIETLEGPRKLDLVLLDARIPGHDLVAMYRRILSIRSNIPVVIYSGVLPSHEVTQELVQISPPTIALKDSRIDPFIQGLIAKFRLGKVT